VSCLTTRFPSKFKGNIFLLHFLERENKMVRIRLRRTGAKNNPTFRIIVADQRAPRDGAFIETIGHYLPTRQPHVLEINEAKAREWLGKGAQPSDTARNLLQQKGILTAEGKIAPEGYVVPAKAPKAAPAPVAAAPAVSADTDLVAPAVEATEAAAS
jgi:small subunit ribosomal protein S16